MHVFQANRSDALDLDTYDNLGMQVPKSHGVGYVKDY